MERKERNRYAARTDLEKSRGEKEGDGVRVLASDSFPFPGSDPLKSLFALIYNLLKQFF